VLTPAMARLRETGYTIHTHGAADLWPLPTYRDLLYLT
jgi:glutamine synthetase type III